MKNSISLKFIFSLILILFLSLISSAEEEQADPYEQEVQEEIKALKKAKEKLYKTLKDLAKKEGEEYTPKEDREFFDTYLNRKFFRRVNKIEKEIAITGSDKAGFEAYIQGKTKESVQLFEKSIREKTDQPFPYYYLAINYFNKGNHKKAEAFFNKVLKVNKKCNSALLMGRLCRKLKGKPKLSDEKMIEVFTENYVESSKSLNLDLDEFTLSPYFSRDPVLYKSNELLFFNKTKVISEINWNDDPYKLFIKCWALNGKLTYNILQLLKYAKGYELDYKRLSLYMKDNPNSSKDKNYIAYTKELDELQKIDPDNGLLYLLRINEKQPKDYTKASPPLDKDELKLLKKAFEAENFYTYDSYMYKERMQVLRDYFAPFKPILGPFYTTDVIRQTYIFNRRCLINLKQLLKEGKYNEAKTLFLQIASIVKKLEQPSMSFLERSILSTAFIPLCRLMSNYAYKKDSSLFKYCTEQIKKYDTMHVNFAGFKISWTVGESPISSLREIYYKTGEEKIRFIESRIYMKMNKEKILKKTLKDIRKYRDKKWASISDEILRLGILKDKRALPLLEEISRNNPKPYNREFAKEAILMIKGEKSGNK